MTDKVQKIKDWISKDQDGLMDENGNFGYPEHEGAYHILCNLDAYIDSLQEEPVSEDWKEEYHRFLEAEWLPNPGKRTMSEFCALIARHFAQWGKKQAEIEVQAQSMALAHGCPEESVSNSLDYAKMTIQRLEKRGMLPTLKGKNLHDFKNEFNTIKQILHLHVYPSSQETIACHFALHWATWGATHLKDLFAVAVSDSKKMDNKQPASDDLKEAADKALESISDQYDIISVGSCLEMFKLGAKWQKQKTVDKACKWIDENAAKYLVDRFVGSTRVVGIDISITEDFRKDMED